MTERQLYSHSSGHLDVWLWLSAVMRKLSDGREANGKCLGHTFFLWSKQWRAGFVPYTTLFLNFRHVLCHVPHHPTLKSVSLGIEVLMPRTRVQAF